MKGALDALVSMAEELKRRMVAADMAALAAEQAQKDLDDYAIRVIPDAMAQAGVTEFKMADGNVLKVEDKVQASITHENRPAAHAWLRDHGHGGVVKSALQVDLRGLEDHQIALLREVSNNIGATTEDIESVHPSTLRSLVKELLEAGTVLPSSIGAHQFKKADIKMKGRSKWASKK